MKLMPQIKWLWRHIYGHQDKNKSFEELDFWSQRNVMMDERAGHCWDANLLHPTQLEEKNATWKLRVNNITVASNFHSTLRNAITGEAGRQYWASRNKIGSARPEAIDWPAMGTALTKLPTHRRHWVSKHQSGFCSVGIQMLRRKEWTHARCPRCHHSPETTEHVWLCTTTDTDIIWTQFLMDLFAWFKSQHTNQEIADTIILRLMQWRSGHAPTPIQVDHPGLAQALLQQDLIGWTSALEGRWGTLWAPLQDAYYKWLNSRQSGHRWLTALIERMWKVAWDLWDHRNAVRLNQHLRDRRVTNAIVIRVEFEKGWCALIRRDQTLFQRGIDVLTQLHPDKQDAWLRRVFGARRRAKHIAERRSLRAQQALLRLWLGNQNP
jgi:hypothetical protein